jgi:uncharacterized protein (TIGR03437 family)
MRRPPRLFFKLTLAAALAATAAASTMMRARAAARASSSNLARAAYQTAANPCGGRIAFDTSRDVNDHFEIYSMSADGTGQTRLTNHTAIDLHPTWSPDGSQIAFQSDRDNLFTGRSDIYVMNSDGTNVRRLTTDPGFDEAPAWSPDGTRIAFLSTRADRDNNNVRQVYLMASDGSSQTQITFGASVQPQLSWSPDGSRIAFSAPAGNQPLLLIYTIAASGGATLPLTAPVSPESDIMPAWSPDGRQVAFSRFRSGQNASTEIYVVNTSDGGGLKNLTNADGDDTYPAWSPDGSSIAFVTNRGSSDRDIYLMFPDGSGQTNLTNTASFFEDRPAWQPPQTPAPCLLTEPGTERAAAVHSVTFTRDPFSVATERNLSSTETRTRVALFCRNLKLLPGEDASAVTVTAENSLHTTVNLPVEFVGKVPGFDWLTQVNVKLPNDLAGEGDVLVSVGLRGSQSNKALMKVSAAGEP